MKRRHVILLLALLFGLVFLTVLTVRQWEEEPWGNLPLIRSSFSTHPMGTKALYRTLSELGFSVARWRKAWRHLDTRQRRTLLFVIEPDPVRLSRPRDWKQLLQFVEAGNAVWLSAQLPGAIAGQSFSGKSFQRARILFPAALLYGVRRYIVNSPTRLVGAWRPPKKVSLPSLKPNREIPLLCDRYGVVLKVIPVGKGFLLVDSNPYALSNEGIDKGDHFRLVLNVVSSVVGRDGRVLFDEWGHGLGEGEHWWWVVAPSTRAAVVQLLIAGILLLVALGIRFGRPVAVPSQPFGRTAFVQGLGTLLQRGNTLREVVGLLELHFLQQAFRDPYLWRLPESEEVEQRLSALPLAQRKQVLWLWQWAERLRRQPRLTEREVLQWARHLPYERQRG
ncbi:MAG: hypothetical protein C4295_01470 [Candidatus Fervidibacterota bacterium]